MAQMSRKNARTRRRAGRGRAALAAVTGLVAVALAVWALQHLAVLVVVLAAAAAAVVLTRRRRARTPAAATGSQAPETPQRQPARKFEQRARSNGWVPPANPELTTIRVSPACAELDCVGCPGGACACPACRHEPRRIAAVNGAFHTAQADPAPPF